MNKRQPFNLLFLITAAVTLVVAAVSIASLYSASVEQQRLRLSEIARYKASLIDVISRTENLDIGADDGEQARLRLLERIATADEEFGSFGDSGEILLARREADSIVFLLARQRETRQLPPPIPFAGDWAEPTRLALSGAAGIVSGTDYRGEKVLAAYLPLADKNLGLVAKLDLAEIRRPFIAAALIAMAAALLAAYAASRLFFRINNPIQQAVDQQAETFLTLAETTGESIILADTRGSIRYVNPATEKLFGYRPNELTGKPLTCLMPPEYARHHDDYLKNYLYSGVPQIIGIGRQLTAVRKDGSRFPIYLSIGDINRGNQRMFAGVIVDISEQQQLQREIIEIAVDEQRRIGRELHDGLGQQLTGLGMLATSLVNKVSKPQHELATRLAAGTQQAIAQVRALSRGLMPVEIDADGFMNSVAVLIDDIRAHGKVPIRLSIQHPVKIADNTVALHLFRIVQEALNNAIKHAGASRIDVVMGKEGARGYIVVRDDGSGGIEPGRQASGLGLRIMRHRCSLIDAELRIASAYTEGTEIKCMFPIDNGDGEPE